MNNIHKFEGNHAPRGPKHNQYGIENLTQVHEQLEVSKSAYEKAINELSEGNLKNLELVKEMEKVLVDFKEIAATLSTGSIEDIAVAKEVTARLNELRQTLEEVKEQQPRLA